MANWLLWLRYAVKARCTPDEAYNSAIFDADEDVRTASNLTALVELDSGCAGHDSPADDLNGRSLTRTSVVVTRLSPGMGPAVGQEVGNLDALWSMRPGCGNTVPQVSIFSTVAGFFTEAVIGR